MDHSSKCAAATLAVVTSAAALIVIGSNTPLHGQGGGQSKDARRRTRFTHDAPTTSEFRSARPPDGTEAPTGFSNQTNGFDPQGPAFGTLNESTVVALRSFNDNRFIFRRSKPRATASDRPATDKVVASATRTLSLAAPAR